MKKITFSPRTIFILCVVLISAVLLTLGLLEQRKVELTASLRGQWVKQVEQQEHAWLELHVGTGEMEYRFASEKYPDYNTVLAKYTFTAVDGSHIRVRFQDGHNAVTEVTIKNGVLMLNPAITATTKIESWKRAN